MIEYNFCIFNVGQKRQRILFFYSLRLSIENDLAYKVQNNLAKDNLEFKLIIFYFKWIEHNLHIKI